MHEDLIRQARQAELEARDSLTTLFLCRACHGGSRVLHSVSNAAGDVLKRRRICLECGRRWTTREREEDADAGTVVWREQMDLPLP